MPRSAEGAFRSRISRILLVDGDVLPAGRRDVEWDGRDDRGQEVATGVYFCRLDARDYHATVRMVLVK